MTKECFMKQFADCKKAMQLNEAADYIHLLLANTLPMLPKMGPLHHERYIRRLAQRTACMELEEAMRSAPPWKDWRVIFAEFEWPYMRRVARHSMDEVYKGPCGKKWGEADAWIVEMWVAYHTIFQLMPGGIPDITPWRIYDNLINHVLKKTARYRRNL